MTRFVLASLVALGCAQGSTEPVAPSVEPTPGGSVVAEPNEPAEPTEGSLATRLGVAEDDLFASAQAGSETWALVRTPVVDDPSQDQLADAIDGECPDGDLECAIRVAGSRDRACAAIGCRAWVLRVDRAAMSAAPLELSPRWPSLETRTRPTLEVRDVDGDGRIEAIATVGVLFEDPDGLWTVRIVRIVDLETGGTQAVFLRRSEHDRFAYEGQSEQYDIVDQSWRIEGARLHLRRVAGEGMCDTGRDGPPEADDDEFDGCAVTVRERSCDYRADVDRYECEGAPLLLPPMVQRQLAWR